MYEDDASSMKTLQHMHTMFMKEDSFVTLQMVRKEYELENVKAVGIGICVGVVKVIY